MSAVSSPSSCAGICILCLQLYQGLQAVGSVGHGCLVGLGTQVGSSGTRAREVSREDGLNEGSEDNLSATEDIYVRAYRIALVDRKSYPV